MADFGLSGLEQEGVAASGGTGFYGDTGWRESADKLGGNTIESRGDQLEVRNDAGLAAGIIGGIITIAGLVIWDKNRQRREERERGE